jgi:hypothetical protein
MGASHFYQGRREQPAGREDSNTVACLFLERRRPAAPFGEKIEDMLEYFDFQDASSITGPILRFYSGPSQ